MTKKEFYDMLTITLDPNFFKFNDTKMQTTVQYPASWENSAFLKKLILGMFGNPHLAYRDWQENPIEAEYKFDSHFVDVDENTIKVDIHGRLYVDKDTLINANNLRPIVKDYVETDGTILQIVNDFISANTETIIDLIVNDEDLINNLAVNPEFITKLVGRDDFIKGLTDNETFTDKIAAKVLTLLPGYHHYRRP